MAEALRAPFPYFGGKRNAAALAWSRFGAVGNYVEPFFGSGAVLLGRPTPFAGVETVNDKDGMVANFWRALRADPDAVAEHADWPCNENDLHARHAWLVDQKESLQARLEGDPDYHDARTAGWWAWGMALWIGGGFCSGEGPWRVVEEGGARKLVRTEGGGGRGVQRQLVHLGDAGQGVKRRLVHLVDAGQGVQRLSTRGGLRDYLRALADRLRHVRVCCGDWSRVLGETPTKVFTPAAVFLDPPYADTAGRDKEIYTEDSLSVAHAAREWALARGGDPDLRIALCGYEGEHEMPGDWECVAGASGQGHGYGGQRKGGYANAGRERIWFSPHCLRPAPTLFDLAEGGDGRHE